MKFLKNGNLTPDEIQRATRAHALIREHGCTPLECGTFVGSDGTVYAFSYETNTGQSESGSKIKVSVGVDGRTTVNNRYV